MKKLGLSRGKNDAVLDEEQGKKWATFLLDRSDFGTPIVNR